MRTCTKCNRQKSEDEFPWKNKSIGRRHSRCKECQKSMSRTWYSDNTSHHKLNVKKNNKLYRVRNRDYIWDYLSSHHCVDCGQNDPIVLEFDHRNPDEKECEVYHLVQRQSSLRKLKEEIEKCDVRCANCHRKKTAIQFGWWADKTSPCSSNGQSSKL